MFGFLTEWRKGEISSLTWSNIHDGVIRLSEGKRHASQMASCALSYFIGTAEQFTSLENRGLAHAAERDLKVKFFTICGGRE